MSLSSSDRQALCAAVDRVPALQGSGIAFIDTNSSELVRQGAAPFIVFQVAPAANPHPAQANPGSETSVGHEVRDLFLNCGAAGATAIGEVVFAAAAAPTGGATGVAAVAMWAGAAASAWQCGVSGVRVYNATFGNPGNNQVLDQSINSPGVTIALDVVGLASAAGAARGVTRLGAAAADAGAAGALWRGEALSRPMRAAISSGLENPGAIARLSNEALNARARLELLNAIGVGLSLSSSATGGVGNRLIVYIAN